MIQVQFKSKLKSKNRFKTIFYFLSIAACTMLIESIYGICIKLFFHAKSTKSNKKKTLMKINNNFL